MFVISALIYGLLLSAFSLIITIICATVSNNKGKKDFWLWGICSQILVLLYLFFAHYLDGSHYLGPIKTIIDTLLCILGTGALAGLVFFTNNKRWKIIMWIATFIIPILVLLFGADLESNMRPYSQRQLESIMDVDLPKYRVTNYEEYSPGGDDWECNCVMQLRKDANDIAFYNVIKEKCRNSIDSTYGTEEYAKWSKTETGYSFHKQFDIKHFLDIVIDPKTGTITYRYLKL